MLKQIVEIAPELVMFVSLLQLPLSAPQLRHVLQIADALITAQGSKTLSALYRSIVDNPDPRNAADTFRLAPWSADDIRLPLRYLLVQLALNLVQALPKQPMIYLSIDDSLTEKDRHSTRLQWVDWNIDLKRSFPGRPPVFTKGTVYVLMRLHISTVSFTIDIRPYLREKTIRRLNRQRSHGDRLKFHSKIRLALMMLEDVQSLLPEDARVCLLMDSWYAAKSLLKWCAERDWQVICRLKSNRNLNGTQVQQHNQSLKNKRYDHVVVDAATSRPPKHYLVRSIVGRLSGMATAGRVFISKKHPRDTRPRYFYCSDVSLSATQALNIYHKRWSCEVVNWYLAELLGWADCRLWRAEAAEKYLMVLWLALAFLEYQQVMQFPSSSLADIARFHRQRHARRLLERACQMAAEQGDLQLVLDTFIVPSAVPT